MCRHGNHLQESCFCVFRRRLFYWGTQREADDRLPQDAKESNSLVQTYTQSHFSLFASSVSLADALLFFLRQFFNEYVKELLHLLH